jgi:3-aminobutyryl-CoA ammonia-lyase
MSSQDESLTHARLSSANERYGGGVVDGARILRLIGDVMTEVLIRHDGDEAVPRTDTAEFLAPVQSGDHLEVGATLVSVRKLSRRLERTAHKVSGPIDRDDSAAKVLAGAILTAKVTSIAVVPLSKQRPARR